MSQLDFSQGMSESMTNMNFGQALDHLRAGERVAREGWNGRDMYIRLHTPDDACGKMTLPYLYIRTATGGHVPWVASQTDLLANDWFVVWSSSQRLVRGLV